MKTQKFDTKDIQLVGIIALISISVRIIYYNLFSEDIWFLNPMVDSVNYDLWAKSILQGNILGEGVFKHSPLYPYLLSIIYLIFGVSVKNIIIVQLAINTLSSILLYCTTRQFFTRSTSFISAFISTIYGPAIFFDSNLLSATFINFINISLILFLYLSLEKDKYIYWITTGFLFGLSILLRPNIILFSFFIFFTVIYSFRKKYNPNKILAILVILFSTTIITISPSVIRNKIVLDEYILTNHTGGTGFYLGNFRNATGYFSNTTDFGIRADIFGDEALRIASKLSGKKLSYRETSRFWYQKAIDEIIEDPKRWLKLTVKKAMLFLNHYEFTTSLNYYLLKEIAPAFKFFQLINFIVILPLGITGMFLSAIYWKKLLPLYGLFIVYFISNTFILVSAEYRFAITPVLYIFSGYTITNIAYSFYNFSWKKLFAILVYLSILTIFVNLNITSLTIINKHKLVGYINLAGTYRKVKNYNNAAQWYKKSLDFTTNKNSYALNNSHYALMQLYSGNKRESLNEIATSYEINPADTEIISIYATILTANGFYDQAITMRLKALNAEPNNIHNLINLGVAYLWAHKDQQANEIFTEVIQITPNKREPLERLKKRILLKRVRDLPQN